MTTFRRGLSTSTDQRTGDEADAEEPSNRAAFHSTTLAKGVDSDR